MKKLFVALLVLSSSMMFGQIAKTGGLLYSNGNPNTRGIDTLVTKNLSKNSEVCIDYTTGTIYTFNRSDSSFVKYDSRPYKVYTAYLNTLDTTNIVATILENTLGTIDWGIVASTNLYATSSGLFTCGKTFILYSPMADRFSLDGDRPGVYITPFTGCEEDDNTYLGFYNNRVDNNDREYVAQIPKLYIEIRVYD